MAARSLAIMATMLAVGCAAPVGNGFNGLSRDYTVTIDPIYQSESQQAIVDATALWEHAVPVTFHVEVGKCPNGPALRQLCFSAVGSPPPPTADGDQTLAKTFPGDDDNATVHLYVYTNEAQETVMAAHELGHCMGLVHHDGAVLMNPMLPQDAVAPTADDVAQWWALR